MTTRQRGIRVHGNLEAGAHPFRKHRPTAQLERRVCRGSPRRLHRASCVLPRTRSSNQSRESRVANREEQHLDLEEVSLTGFGVSRLLDSGSFVSRTGSERIYCLRLGVRSALLGLPPRPGTLLQANRSLELGRRLQGQFPPGFRSPPRDRPKPPRLVFRQVSSLRWRRVLQNDR